MENQKRAHLKGALILSLIIILLELAQYLSNRMASVGFTLSIYLVLFVGIVAVCMLRSKQKGGKITFGDLFAFGFKTVATVILIFILWNILMYKVLFPDLVGRLTAAQTMGATTQDAVDNRNFIVFIMERIILVFALIGVVGSMIGAAVSKKQPPIVPPSGNK